MDLNTLTQPYWNELRAQGAQISEIGYSLLGRPILAVHKGSYDGAQVVVQAGIHAREWATIPLSLAMMSRYGGSGGVWCVPYTNPDGTLLCLQGLQSVPDEGLKSFLLSVNGNSLNFSAWKANARAVDLNVNFNADWGSGKQNVFAPSPSDYVGARPQSEPETQTLVEFTLRNQPALTLSYHAKGSVIYQGFGCRVPYPEQASQLARQMGYPLLSSEGSAGGYKDWYVATTGKIGLTVEIGRSDQTYEQIYEDLDAQIARQDGVLELASQIAVRTRG